MNFYLYIFGNVLYCGILYSLLNDYQSIKRELHKSFEDGNVNEVYNKHSSELKFISAIVVIVTILIFFLNILQWF